jgi:integral membrane protein, TerC family
MSTRKAIFWSIFWIVLSLLMNVAVYFAFGAQKALEFLTGYVIEKSLSVDNLFIFLLIFTYFNVEPVQQRRVLNFGIIGVIILRGVLILLGTVLVKEFHWVMYIFGAVLLYSGYRVTFGKEKRIEPDHSIVLKVFRKLIPVSDDYRNGHFFFREKGVLHATSLFVVLLIIETTDVVFAVDSIPAIFAITTDPFIVFSSNIMAVLGLRSMYFVLEKGQQKFEYMKYGVGIVLGYVGVKMLMMDIYKINIIVSLLIVAVILSLSVLLSYIVQPKRSASS